MSDIRYKDKNRFLIVSTQILLYITQINIHTIATFIRRGEKDVTSPFNSLHMVEEEGPSLLRSSDIASSTSSTTVVEGDGVASERELCGKICPMSNWVLLHGKNHQNQIACQAHSVVSMSPHLFGLSLWGLFDVTLSPPSSSFFSDNTWASDHSLSLVTSLDKRGGAELLLVVVAILEDDGGTWLNGFCASLTFHPKADVAVWNQSLPTFQRVGIKLEFGLWTNVDSIMVHLLSSWRQMTGTG